jgi:hypothetical protein
MLSMKTAWGENPALSYRNLRAITGYVGLTLPVVLLIDGLVDGHIESSLSAYYYTKVGNVFTGALCVIGIFLLAYRLTAWAIDNIVTTLAGIAALGVAFFHAAPQHATQDQLWLADVHLTCATALFILLGGISLLIFPGDIAPDQPRWPANWYRAFGALIWLSLILMPVLSSLAGSFYNDNHMFFALETVCVMAFAVSFILKGHGQPSDPTLDDRAADQPPPAAVPPPHRRSRSQAYSRLTQSPRVVRPCSGSQQVVHFWWLPSSRRHALEGRDDRQGDRNRRGGQDLACLSQIHGTGDGHHPHRMARGQGGRVAVLRTRGSVPCFASQQRPWPHGHRLRRSLPQTLREQVNEAPDGAGAHNENGPDKPGHEMRSVGCPKAQQAEDVEDNHEQNAEQDRNQHGRCRKPFHVRNATPCCLPLALRQVSQALAQIGPRVCVECSRPERILLATEVRVVSERVAEQLLAEVPQA